MFKCDLKLHFTDIYFPCFVDFASHFSDVSCFIRVNFLSFIDIWNDL